jgi:hypothetical protein
VAHWRWVLVEQRTLLLLECREPWAALRCSRGVVPLVQKDRSKSVSSAWPLALSRMFSGFRSLCKQSDGRQLVADTAPCGCFQPTELAQSLDICKPSG